MVGIVVDLPAGREGGERFGVVEDGMAAVPGPVVPAAGDVGGEELAGVATGVEEQDDGAGFADGAGCGYGRRRVADPQSSAGGMGGGAGEGRLDSLQSVEGAAHQAQLQQRQDHNGGG